MITTAAPLFADGAGHARHAGKNAGGPRQGDAVYDEGADWTWLLGTAASADHIAYSDEQPRRGQFWDGPVVRLRDIK